MRGQNIDIPRGKIVLRALAICPRCSDIVQVRLPDNLRIHGKVIAIACQECGKQDTLNFDAMDGADG